MTKISSKSIVAASANQKIPVSPDNAISPNTIKIYADAAVDLTTVEAVALGASADDGTLYRITGTGGSPLPTGIDNILIWGASSMAGGFDYGNARASVTALGVYVPCTYDVATNKIIVTIKGYKVSLTNSQLKNDLPITGVEVIPAFGAGTYVNPKSCAGLLTATTPLNNGTTLILAQGANPFFRTTALVFADATNFFQLFAYDSGSTFELNENTPTSAFDPGGVVSTSGDGTLELYIDFDIVFN